MHFCTAHIAIGSDDRNTMVRGEYNPVSWPEIEILRLVHGEHAITEVVPFAEVRQDPKSERERLSEIYGAEHCANAWGGRSSPSEMNAPGVKLKAGIEWVNPLTYETEITGTDDAEPPFGPGPVEKKK
jgi:hypothetical protein